MTCCTATRSAGSGSTSPTRDQQQQVANAIFAEVRKLYAQLDAVGRRGVARERRELRRA